MPEAVPRPTVGHVVHYVLPAGQRKGRIRKADVVDVPAAEWISSCELIVSLAAGDVSRSADNDGSFGGAVVRDSAGGALFIRVVAAYGGADQPGTWFWPPRSP